MLLSLWQLCTFQLHVRDISISFANKILATLLFLGAFIAVIWLADHSLLIAAWKALLLGMITILYSLILLQMRALESSFSKTITALFSAQGLIIALLIVPYVLLMNVLPEIHSTSYYLPMLILSTLLMMAASLWLFMIVASIYEQALDVPMHQALWLTLLLFGTEALVFGMLYF